jgi:tetrapyrrole methylase family protein / MazG family protein
MIHVVGLGPGDPQRLPPRAFALLTGGLPVYLRTARHPTLTGGTLAAALSSVRVTALDDEYENNPSFEDTYAAIVARVLRAQAAEGEIVYAVPGHPLIGETTVARLLDEARQRGVAVKIVGAPSFVDACLEAVGVAVTGDLHVIDALTLDPAAPAPPDALRTGGPLVLYQVHSRDAASNVKLALMRAGYPDEFPVTVVRAAGVPEQETVRTLPLFELDRGREHDHLTSVYVPPLAEEERRASFYDLVRVMARLRDPGGGCPWDLEQTHRTLRRYVLEEAYEVAEAIDTGDPDKLREELGDLLLQVVFHAQLAAEEGVYEVDDVCATIVEKLIRRHPHVFGEVKAETPDEVLNNWQAIKAAEKGNQDRVSILDGIPASLPALMAAMEVSRRAVKAGFEWPDVGGVLDKVEEEFAELRAEVEADAPKEKVSAELGDLLFTLVNVGRRIGVEPEDALRGQMERFKRRFRHIERHAAEQGRPLESLTLNEMEDLWREAKGQEVQTSHPGSE